MDVVLNILMILEGFLQGKISLVVAKIPLRNYLSRVFFCLSFNRIKRKGRCIVKTAKHKSVGHPVTSIVGIVIGIGVSLVISLLLSAIVAFAVNGEGLQQNAINNAAVPIQVISIFIGCITAILLTGNMPAVVAAACTGGYIAILVCINVLLMNSGLNGAGKGIAVIIIGGASSVAVSLLGKGNKKRKSITHSKYIR